MLVTSCWFGLLRFTCQTIHTMRVSSRARNYMHDVLVHASVWIIEHTDKIYRSAFPKLCCYTCVPLQFSLTFRASQRTKIVTNMTSTWLAYVWEAVGAGRGWHGHADTAARWRTRRGALAHVTYRNTVQVAVANSTAQTTTKCEKHIKGGRDTYPTKVQIECLLCSHVCDNVSGTTTMKMQRITNCTRHV